MDLQLEGQRPTLISTVCVKESEWSDDRVETPLYFNHVFVFHLETRSTLKLY